MEYMHETEMVYFLILMVISSQDIVIRKILLP